MKKIVALFFSLLLLSGCTSGPSQNPTASIVPSSSEDVPVYVTATFVVGEGVTPIAPQSVEVGQKFRKPTDPVKDKYTFGGWFTDESYLSIFDFNIAYTSDQTIYAKWDEITYEYYLYGRLNFVDVYLPHLYKQEQFRLSTPKEEDADAVVAIYNFHIMPSDDVQLFV